MVTAVGRVAVPRPNATGGDYLADELLWCLLCRRWLRPAPQVDGTRVYSCGPPCSQPALAAEPVELDLVLGAVTRAVTALHPELARVQHGDAAFAHWSAAEQPQADAAEVRRWQMCDLSDRRAMLRAAYLRVEVNAQGQLRPVWRHRPGAAS